MTARMTGDMILLKLLMKQSKLRFIFLLALASVVYVSLTLSAVFQKSHILYNLEPYPDGLLYALSARNFALQGKLELQYESSILPFWTQPLYSLLLVPLFTLSQHPEMFFISNVVMGVVTLSVVSWAVWKRTKNVLLVLLSQVILLFAEGGLPLQVSRTCRGIFLLTVSRHYGHFDV